MAFKSVKFYNMQVHLIQNNRIYEENAAVKNVWRKDGNIFLDLYFYRMRKSYIFDAVFIHDIIDLSTEKIYRKMDDFLSDFDFVANLEEKEQTTIKEVKIIPDNKIFEPIYSELIIMSFFANCCEHYSLLKEKIILDYIIRKLPPAQNLSRTYLDGYLNNLKPTHEDFYSAINKLNYQNPQQIEDMCFEVLKICLSDGRLHHNEKRYLADLLQILREVGVRIDLGL